MLHCSMKRKRQRCAKVPRIFDAPIVAPIAIARFDTPQVWELARRRRPGSRRRRAVAANFTHFSLTTAKDRNPAEGTPKIRISPGSRRNEPYPARRIAAERVTKDCFSMPFAAPLAARAVALALSASLAFAASAALAETKPAEKSKTDAPAVKPELVGSYGDWSVFQSQSGKNKVCYALAQPKQRDPDDLKRDPGYAFISERPGEGARNEVSLIMGFDVGAPSADSETDSKDKKKSKLVAPTAVVGDSSFDLLPKGANLWVKNAAQESALVAEMRKGKTLVVKASSKKGNLTTDTYSLSGFAQAIDRALKDCPGG
jgi:invasion protein IalB